MIILVSNKNNSYICKKMEEEHLRVLEQLGFNIKNKTYQDVVGELIEQHIQIMMEIESSNIELFKQEVKRVMKPTN